MQKHLFEQLECVCAWNECMNPHCVNAWEHEHGVNEQKVAGVNVHAERLAVNRCAEPSAWR